MSNSEQPKSHVPATSVLVVLLITCVTGFWFFQDRQEWPRSEALSIALKPLIDQKDTDQSLVAQTILDNFIETRTNASRWSGVYWGFTFTAAVFSALAGLILKFEFILRNEALKKDLAAILSMTAALLITISTSGDFQRKWQANRIAAAELERTGYELLEKNGKDSRQYLAIVGQILLRRNFLIVGTSDNKTQSVR
jgi:hypothetical protein